MDCIEQDVQPIAVGANARAGAGETSPPKLKSKPSNPHNVAMRPDTFNTLFDLLCLEYPKAFTRDPRKIRPLKPGVLNDLVLERGDALHRPFKAVIAQYEHWPSYLFAVVYGKRRHDLQGNKAGRVTLIERQQAARMLEHLGLWSDAHQKQFEDSQTPMQ